MFLVCRENLFLLLGAQKTNYKEIVSLLQHCLHCSYKTLNNKQEEHLLT